MWRGFRHLKQQGVLGLNRRNGDYVLRYNQRKSYPLVDDKLKTKSLALKAGIPVPTLYASIEAEHQLKAIDHLLEPHTDFVIKPAHGAGGDGIVVVTNRVFDCYRLVNGEIWHINDLVYHISCLLSGVYSLSGHPDTAIIERRVEVDSVFASISHEGVPDIRVITLLGYPAMAMLRLPTRLSHGKANLHQGAIGVGVDIATGLTREAVLHHEPIAYHPDTLCQTAGIIVPYWDEILNISAAAYELTGLGYLGVDIVLDKTAGPLMLELNARPGLNIQIANQSGLLGAYQALEAEAEKQGFSAPAHERVAFSKALHASRTPMLEGADTLYLDGK